MTKLTVLSAIALLGAPLMAGAQPAENISVQQQSSAVAVPSGIVKYIGFAGPDISLTAADNWKTAATYLPPTGDKPVAILVHSIGRQKEDWKPLALELSHQGFGYLALDLRGHGASCTDPTGATTTWRNFRRAGTDNEFNQITRDLEAATAFLAANGVEESRIIMIGAGIGANLAIKFSALHPQIMMTALLAPTLNASRDVLSVNPMRVYGNRPLLLLASVDDQRVFKESLILHSIAKMGAGNDNIIFITVAKGPSWRMTTKPIIATLIQWIKTPVIPSVNPAASAAGAAKVETEQTDAQEEDDATDDMTAPESAAEESQ